MKLKNNKYKVYIDIKGRLGNQMFQYAFLRVICQTILVSDVFINFKKTYYDQGAFSGNNLKFFNVIQYHECIPIKSCLVDHGSVKQDKLLNFYRNRVVKIAEKTGFLSFFARLFHKILQRNGIYFDDKYFKYYHNIIPKTELIFIKGYFEYPKLLVNIENLLKDEFTIKEEFVDYKKIETMMKYVKSKNSTCVMYRSWREVQENEKKYLNICDSDYYSNAILKMNSLAENCRFIVFSDDIELAKSFFAKANAVFEPDGLTIPEKIIAMTSCSNYIMCNSTFAWWIQFLSQNKNKIVLSKPSWTIDKKIKNELVLKDWIKIYY